MLAGLASLGASFLGLWLSSSLLPVFSYSLPCVLVSVDLVCFSHTLLLTCLISVCTVVSFYPQFITSYVCPFKIKLVKLKLACNFFFFKLQAPSKLMMSLAIWYEVLLIFPSFFSYLGHWKRLCLWKMQIVQQVWRLTENRGSQLSSNIGNPREKKNPRQWRYSWLSDEFRKVCQQGSTSSKGTSKAPLLQCLMAAGVPRLADTSLQSLALFSYAFSPSVSSVSYKILAIGFRLHLGLPWWLRQ